MAQEFFLGIRLGVTGAAAIGAALSSVQSSLKGLGDAARRLQSEQDRLGEAIRRHMGTLAPQTLAALNRDYERLGRTIEAVTRRQETLSRAMQRRADLAAERRRIGGEIMGVYGTALAVGAPVIGAVREAAGFGDAVKDIAIVGELTREEEARLGASLRRVALSVNQTAADMARGVGLLIANGMAADKAAQQAELLGRFTTATRASFDDAARMMVSFDLLGVSAQDMALVFSQAAKAGKLGSFEVRDMAKWFPQLGGYLKAIGVTGTEAVVNMASRLQIAMKTAGSTDEAANNFRNFLAKLTSPDTAKDFEKLGIDLQGSMLRAARQGIDPIESAITVIMGKMAKTSPQVAAELNALSREIGAIKDPAERAAELERRRAMIEALGQRAGLGQMFQDMQAVSYLLAELQNRDELKRIQTETASGRNADGQMALDADFAKRMQSPVEQFKALKIALQDMAMAVGDALLPALADIVQAIKPVVLGMAEWAKAHPALIKGALGLALGIAGVKAAALSLGWALNFFAKSPLASMSVAWQTLAARAAIGRAALIAGASPLRAIAAAAGLSGGAIARLGAALAAFRAVATAALTAVGRAVLWLGRAVMLNPIGLVLTAIAGTAYLIWRHWDKIGPMLGKVWDGIKTGFARAWAWLKGLPGQMLAIGQQIVGGLIDGIKSRLAARAAIGRAALIAGASPLRAIAAAAGLSGGGIARLGAALAAFRAVATAALMAVGRAVLWLGRAVMLNPIGLVLTAIAGTAYLIWRHWDKIGPMLGKVWDGIKTGFARAWAWLKGLPGQMLAIGQQIVGGLIDGIKSRLAAAGDAIKGLGQSVVSGLKNLLGIRSPSRVFAELGGFVAEGFAGGVADKSALAKKAIGGLAAASVAVSVPAFGATGAGGAAPMQITFAPNITVTGAASPEAARQQVAQAVQMSFAEFERLMRRYEHERRRVAP